MPSHAIAPPVVLLKPPAARPGRDASVLDSDVTAETVPESQITISRQSPDDVGFREIFISLDGTPITILRNGDTFTTDVSSGAHRLRAHNTLFWKTHDIVLKPGEHLRFTAINRAGWGTFGMLFFLGAMPVYLTFEPVRSDSETSSYSPPARS